jgi:hypothetical protein
MQVLGRGPITDRFTTELWTHGTYAYVATGGFRGAGTAPDPAVLIWNIAGATPVKVDSVVVGGAATLGDVQVSDDGRLLVVATEYAPGSIVVYDLADPRKPVRLARFSSANTERGVHTAEVARVNGTLYAFLSIDPTVTSAGLTVEGSSKLVIVDLTDPRQPREVLARAMGTPFIHDVFVRDGLLFTALWDEGLAIWDIGGGGRGGSVQNPVFISVVLTKDGNVHNVWWMKDASTGATRYAFVGEESNPFTTGVQATGDLHVVDLQDLAHPREVARYTVPGAGAHNISIDEQRGILYAAFYNGGVRAIDVRGALGDCPTVGRLSDGRCDLTTMGRELGVGLQTSEKVFIWGVRYDGSAVYASDMLNGLWKLAPLSR